MESAEKRLCYLAHLLAECKLYGQAVTLVCLAMEQVLIETMGLKRHPGYYAVQYLKEVFRAAEDKKSKYRAFSFNIANLRNRIAHAGLPDSNDPTIPQAESLQGQYEKISRQQQELCEYLKHDFRVPEEFEEKIKAGVKPWEEKKRAPEKSTPDNA